MRQSEKVARHNLKLWKGKYKDEKPELWHVFLAVGSKEHRRNPTWEAWVILDSRLHITDVRDPHFDDLLDDPSNYEQLEV